MQEKRLSRRHDINVQIRLNKLKSPNAEQLDQNEYEVEVVNISKDGLGFKSKEQFMVGAFYDAKVVLWTKETFSTVVEIVRAEELSDSSKLFGCRFIGILPQDRMKIEIYEIVSVVSE